MEIASKKKWLATTTVAFIAMTLMAGCGNADIAGGIYNCELCRDVVCGVEVYNDYGDGDPVFCAGTGRRLTRREIEIIELWRQDERQFITTHPIWNFPSDFFETEISLTLEREIFSSSTQVITVMLTNTTSKVLYVSICTLPEFMDARFFLTKLYRDEWHIVPISPHLTTLIGPERVPFELNPCESYPIAILVSYMMPYNTFFPGTYRIIMRSGDYHLFLIDYTNKDLYTDSPTFSSAFCDVGMMWVEFVITDE